MSRRQEALLAAISEKDANIALLELSSSKKKKTQDEVAALKREKDSLVHQLKQQVGLVTHTHTHLDMQVSSREEGVDAEEEVKRRTITQTRERGKREEDIKRERERAGEASWRRGVKEAKKTREARTEKN